MENRKPNNFLEIALCSINVLIKTFIFENHFMQPEAWRGMAPSTLTVRKKPVRSLSNYYSTTVTSGFQTGR